MISILFEKLYHMERKQEPCQIAIPVKKGTLLNTEQIHLCVKQRSEDGKEIYHIEVPCQIKVTSKWEDNSIRWMLIRFLADLPKDSKAEYQLYLPGDEFPERKAGEQKQISVLELIEGERIIVDTGAIRFTTGTAWNSIFENIFYGGNTYRAEHFVGPLLTDINGESYPFQIKSFEVIEQGPICVVLHGVGYHESAGCSLRAEINLTAYAGRPDIEVAYRLVNTSREPLSIGSLVFQMKPLSVVERALVASSNYRTKILESRDGEPLENVIDADSLLFEANEHIPEVFYGTFFADLTTKESGVCATIYQAHQNFPKALRTDKNGMQIKLVPDCEDKVVMQPGMAREQKVLLHFHAADEPVEEINHQSIVYQMPDRPHLKPEVYQEAEVMHDVFVEHPITEVEIALVQKADAHARCYGMLNWGDAPDQGYTAQGRGGGSLVWTNNEYDYPHACALLYAKTGIRRFLDYLLVAGRHWMDVDVCHFSDDPLIMGGQWEHTKGHTIGGKIVCSHQWVEGLLDYYHFTGDEEAFRTAIGIGHNILRLLDTPMFQQKGEINARETGWALRSLVAIYKETHDVDWLNKCNWIVGHFEEWEKEYGHWLSPYTDNTAIRVPFMISIAVGSLMRYYRIRPSEKLKEMILRAVDDMIENCYMKDYGLFYYKELESLQRLGKNPIILEALTIAYELTGNKEYLDYGKKTFQVQIMGSQENGGGPKQKKEDTVIVSGAGTKNFAQSFLPLITYYKACSFEGMILF